MTRKALFGGVFAASFGAAVAVANVPTIDWAAVTKYLELIGIQLLDRDNQIETQTVEAQKEIVKKEISTTQAATLAATSGTRTVYSELSSTAPYTDNPLAAETSGDATRLFGNPHPTLESKIVQTAMNFKDSAGVRRAGLDPLTWRIMFQSLVKQESAFNVRAESPVGAYGLTQLMPGTAGDLGVNRYVIEENLRGGATYITDQLEAFGQIDHALAAYNAGPGRVREYNGVPPFKETQGYVARIRQFMREYIAKYGGHLPDATFTEGLMSNGEFGYVAASLAAYAEYSLIETNKAVARLQEISAKIDASPDLQYSTALKVAAVVEVEKLQLILIRLRAASAEAQATYWVASAQITAEGNDYWDWSYNK